MKLHLDQSVSKIFKKAKGEALIWLSVISKFSKAAFTDSLSQLVLPLLKTMSRSVGSDNEG
jgi:hypothetical protein